MNSPGSVEKARNSALYYMKDIPTLPDLHSMVNFFSSRYKIIGLFGYARRFLLK